jgi:outer membrane protein OmpA-like peptidoglycan-associated protein
MPSDKIELAFKVDQQLPERAWIGLVPSNIPHGSEDTNDQHDISYQYVGDKTSGTFTFDAPDKSGSYDLRLNDSDGGGTEIASVTFTVGEIKKEGTLKLSKTTFLPGEQIEVTFTASDTLPRSAWVGMVPSKVEHGKEDVNDQHDIQWQYVEKKTSGKMLFTAPPDSGSYDLRLNSDDSGGVEITAVTFQVGGKLDAGGISKLLEEQGKLALYGIQFDFNQATIKPESAQVLSQVGEVLKNQPDLKLMIEGHTDNVGKPAYNMELSRKRAQSVKDYLVQNHQVDAARLSTQGFGDTKPMAKNDTEAGRAQNRRVELVKQ